MPALSSLRRGVAWSSCLWLRLLADGAGLPAAPAAGSAQTHVDQSVLTVIAADTVAGLQARTSRLECVHQGVLL